MNGGDLTAICRRWRIALSGKTEDGIHIPLQTGRCFLRGLSGLAARVVSIHPRKQRNVPICQLGVPICVWFDQAGENFHTTALMLGRTRILVRPRH